MGTAQTVAMIVMVPLLVAAYLFPSLIALIRGHHQGGPIFVINLFLGWMIIPWILTLAWSVSYIISREDEDEEELEEA